MTDRYLPDDFTRRHLGPTKNEVAEMVAYTGAKSLDALIEETVPASLRQSEKLEWGEALSEVQSLAKLREIANKNEVMTSLIGQGFHDVITPPVIQRNIFENPAWYTAYTPYQPEISQGRLEALLNFQTLISDLTGLPVANASLLDEASAAAEAMQMARRISKAKTDKYFVDRNCHPQNIAVMRTRAEPLGIELVVGSRGDLKPDEVFGAVFQYPGTEGEVHDYTDEIADLHANKAVVTMIADPMALVLLKEPGAMGADIAIGSAQRFGVPMGFGGPSAAYMAVADQHKRTLPGRIVGVSKDSRGNPAMRLALQTREQHIRREKATSNICTAQALLAVMASFYAVYHGPRGLRAIAKRIHGMTAALQSALACHGFAVIHQNYFDTLTLDLGEDAQRYIKAARKNGLNLRNYKDGRVGITLDETSDFSVIKRILTAFGIEDCPSELAKSLPETALRDTTILEHPVFQMNKSETAIMRYMRKLADRDLALDRAMIPLGSCTMKLNAAAEMIPVSWPEFARIHPFAPKKQVEGYLEMFDDLSDKLCQITGYDGFSLQPNSGAQGEYAGLMTIRAYHRANGDTERNICLIPISAHGTNPASAQMAGMKVVVVKALENGDIDVEDFRAKAAVAGKNLAAAMITYPSTHGVFEHNVREVCDIVHEFGGQVYIDGANLNAMVGLVRPGDLGGDVSHLNLHKTFCIPHGGGGPGMGPIGVKAHLVDHLPGHPNKPISGKACGPVTATAYGSASILPISYGYCLMMGGDGLTEATREAILAANYLAKRLGEDYKILYKGQNGRIAHECILDVRPYAQSAGVTVDDIAKRLVDFGFHAPTMSWPVAGTLMIEPTESEPKTEIDRFCDAMLAIRAEIRQIEQEEITHSESPLAHAPHTLADMVEDWDRKYDRRTGVTPGLPTLTDKYWPAVNRVDNVHGDRNLVCTCPPLSDYLHAAE